jgi:hypothetical protein
MSKEAIKRTKSSNPTQSKLKKPFVVYKLPYDLFRPNLVLENFCQASQDVAMGCNSVVPEATTRQPNLRRRSELSIQ